jgi:hypothetical protein
MEETLAAAERGDYLSARKASEELAYRLPRLRKVPVKPSFGLSWDAFCEACVIAERIDSFLAALLREKVSGALARDCYRDLSLLPVLADWAAESGRPATAAEARHLHDLVRYRG